VAAHSYTRIAKVASQQRGNVTAAQLLSIGISRDTIYRLARSGLLTRRHRGVYAFGYPDPSDASKYAAAVLAVGGDAALSHCTAAHHLGILRRRPCSVHVTATRKATLPGIRTSRVSSMPQTRLHKNVLVVDIGQTILDVACECDVEELANVIHEAQFRFDFDPRPLADLSRGRRGGSTVRAALRLNDGGAAGTKSGLEQAVRRYLVARSGVEAPVPNARIAVHGGELEVDLWWPGRSLVVEVDGPGHDRKRTRREDLVRDERLRAVGIRPLRVDGVAFRRDPKRATATVIAALIGGGCPDRGMREFLTSARPVITRLVGNRRHARPCYQPRLTCGALAGPGRARCDAISRCPDARYDPQRCLPRSTPTPSRPSAPRPHARW
jgi:hypothetical protein